MRQIASYALLAGIVIGSVPCSAAPIDLTPHVNFNLNADYHRGDLYPPNGGPITIGGIDFVLNSLPGSGTGVVQADADVYTTFNIAVGHAGVATVYAIINSKFGAPGALNGKLTFIGSGGATWDYLLTQGDNIRDHAANPPAFNQLAPNVYATATFTDNQDGDNRLDVLRIILPAIFASQTLDTIVFSYLGSTVPGDGFPFIAAITTSTDAVNPVPLPAALPLFATVLAGGGFVAWRRKRRQQRAA